MNIKTNAAKTALITAGVVGVSALVLLGFTTIGIMVAAVILLFAGGEFAAINFMRKSVLKRKQNIFVTLSIVLMGVTALISLADLRFAWYNLPAWCAVLGLLFLISGNYILISALVAVPRHAKEEYGEDFKPDTTVLSLHGPYDVIRHPINLAGFLIAFSLPLMLSSAFGFIGSVITAVFIITHAITIENYRFEEYSWYYDYTKKVPFMMIPVIW